MKKTLFTLIVSICLLPVAYGSGNDSNVVISNAKVAYSFDYNKKENSVKIKEGTSTTYNCLSYRTVISIAEFYDDKTGIDEVKAYVDGSKARNIIPQYEYYSVDNIFYSDVHVCYFIYP